MNTIALTAGLLYMFVLGRVAWRLVLVYWAVLINRS